jgi:hypothetical protein
MDAWALYHQVKKQFFYPLSDAKQLDWEVGLKAFYKSEPFALIV